MSLDLGAFERRLEALHLSLDPRQNTLFERASPLFVARAPGRLDVMGGFADYSGSLTLEMPIAEATFVAVQRSSAPTVRIFSTELAPASSGSRGALGEPASDGCRYAEFALGDLAPELDSYARAHDYFRRDPAQRWTAYVAGALAALHVEFGQPLSHGLNLLVASSVPEGKGVSSSAALEVASFSALAALYGIDVDPARAAILCQRIENLVVGAPCGVMDQMTASCGREGELLPLVCQPAKLEACFRVPAGLALFGIDSGLRHQVSGADYTQVRVAAFMAYRMIAQALGLQVGPAARAGHVTIADPVYAGYLANVPPAVFEQEHRGTLPELCTGAEFLSQFGGINDPITNVRPDVSYRVRAAAAHPIFEHQRATEYRRRMLELAAPDITRAELHESGQRLGELMFAAHASYSACGLGSTGTDRLVELVRELGPEQGLYGAKITGGGSGGTVAVLGQHQAHAGIERVRQQYASETGHEPYLFVGSSPGAAAFGALSATWEGSAWRVAPRTSWRPPAAGPRGQVGRSS
jgi:galactokinase